MRSATVCRTLFRTYTATASGLYSSAVYSQNEVFPPGALKVQHRQDHRFLLPNRFFFLYPPPAHCVLASHTVRSKPLEEPTLP